MKQKISLFYVAIAFSIAGLCTSCSSDDPVDDTGGGTNNPGGTSSDVKQLDYGELLAFPYAEGHGRNTTGGRGGKVYHVTSLEDDTSGSISGSLRWAMKQDGPKTIVFDVSGTIYLKSELKTQKDDLTIAGQTSPGGICIANYPFTINSSNIIIRFIRFRPGNSNVDCDGLGGCDKQNVIIDHCSVSWGSDECLSVYGMQNSTVQWCLAYQALRVTNVKINAATGKFASHGYGGNWGGNYASYHHNLIAHCESRVPRLGPRYTTLALNNNDGERVDMRNNVYYNWGGEGCYGGEAQHVNIVNNYYKPGPGTDESGKADRAYRIAKPDVYPENYSGEAYKKWLQTWGKFYIDGNKVVGNTTVSNDNWTKGVFEQMDEKNCATTELWNQHTQIKSNSPVVKAGNVRTHTPDEAYERVMSYAGASNYRDKVDELIISDVKNRKASCTGDASKWKDLSGYSQNKSGYINDPKDVCTALGVSDPYDVLKSVTNANVKDTDGDGIPDYWEEEYGLNPKKSADGKETTIDKNGKYTNLEMYLNSLVHEIMVNGATGGSVIE